MIQRAYQKGTVIPQGQETLEAREKRIFFQNCRTLGLAPHLSHTSDYFAEQYGNRNDIPQLRYLILHLLVQDDTGHLCSTLEPEIFLEQSRIWTGQRDDQEEESPSLSALYTLLNELSANLPGLLEDNDRLFSSSEDLKVPFCAPYPDTPSVYYLQRNHRDEKELVQNLEQRLAPGSALELGCSSEQKSRILKETAAGSPYADSSELLEQAFEISLENRLLIISGGPGTGKTTLVTYLLRALLMAGKEKEQTLDIAVAAPTGRAAMRVLESMNRECEKGSCIVDSLLPGSCFTLHRLLGLYGGQIRSSDKPPLLQDVIIVDEASMVDIHIMGELFSRLLPSTLLVLVGDKDQLPSVDSGALLGDFLYGSKEPDYRLKGRVLLLEQVYRSRKEILDLAHPVKTGDSQGVLGVLKQRRKSLSDIKLFSGADVCYSPIPDLKKLPGFISLPFSSLKKTGRGFSLSVERWEEKREEVENIFSLFEKFGVLTPLRRGPLGADSLNRSLDLLFSGKESLPYHGRPVMITSNLYPLELYNGDRGVVLSFHGEFYLFFPDHEGGFRYFSYSKVSELETSYVQTIHKSQGSEYENVILLLPEQGERLLTREILYTGMTRARESLVFLSDNETVEKAVSRGVIRNSRVRTFCSGH